MNAVSLVSDDCTASGPAPTTSAWHSNSRAQPHDTAALKDAELAAAMLDDVDEAGGAATVRYDAVHAAPEFWSALRAFLQTHFSEEDAAEVERRFEAAHYAFAEGLSAEDLEDVAAATAPPVPPQ